MGETPMLRMTRFAHIWIPLLVILVLAAPSVPFMLPACEDYLDEIYQPLQTLKFFKTKGQAFHKYAPLPNFVLAPGYGVSLGYWRMTGSFAKPSENFPYGFKRPFEQMGFLIFQGRVIFLALSLTCFAYLAHTLRLVTENRLVILFAFLLCIATNYALVYALPNPKPDAPMLAFSAAAIAVYVRILYLGLTTRRGVMLSLFAVCAVSSKELAGPMFVLPYLGLAWIAWKQRDAIKPFCISVATGVVAYALLNIVYAPSTWLKRMKFWIGGAGIDPGVWGGGGLKHRIVGGLACMLDNLGPAGAIVAVIALTCVLAFRPRRWVMLILPLVSVLILGVGRIQYPADRFFTIVSVAMVPVVAMGLARIAKPQAAIGALTLATCVNLWFATFTWNYLHSTFEYVAERHALGHAGHSDTLYLLSTHDRNENSSRFDYLGYHTDARSIQKMASSGANLPDWIYATEGELQFMEDARKLPARAKMMKEESNFNVNEWRGVEALGYRLDATLIPQTPRWFVFNWMPAIREWQPRRAVFVYRRK